MKKAKPNKGLLNKQRFEVWEREKRRWLENLSLKEALSLEESLLSSELIWLWRRNFLKDKPVCLKVSLKKK